LLRSCTAHGGRRQTGVEFDYATASLAGRHPDSKAGMVTITMLWIFGALTLGWVGYAIGRGPGRKQLNPASAGVSRLTAARRFDFLGFTSIFRMLSLSPRRKRAAAPD